jgi:hypothetical protein
MHLNILIKNIKMKNKKPRIYTVRSNYIREDRRVGIDYSIGLPMDMPLNILEGLVCDTDNNPFTGFSQYVVRELYELTFAKVFRATERYVPHPTLVKGAPVIGAGKARINHGLVELVDAESGHYMDYFDPVSYSRNTLRSFWIAFEKARMKMAKNTVSSLKYIVPR